MKKLRILCPVCGYQLEYGGLDGVVCPSCGVEFGIDTVGHSIEELRQEWLLSGASWQSPVDRPPKNWNGLAQLASLIVSPIRVTSSASEARIEGELRHYAVSVSAA